jgi:hypothetical protein
MPTTTMCSDRQRVVAVEAVTAAWTGPMPAGLVTMTR